jgi:hypothetical protein
MLTTMILLPRSRSMSRPCLSWTNDLGSRTACQSPCEELNQSSTTVPGTSPLLDRLSSTPLTVHRSLTRNGPMSLPGKQSTLTEFYPASMSLLKTPKSKKGLGNLRSQPRYHHSRGRFATTVAGTQPGNLPLMPHRMSSLTDSQSSRTMDPTSLTSSERSHSTCILGPSTLTEPSELESQAAKTCFSPITPASMTFQLSGFKQEAQPLLHLPPLSARVNNRLGPRTHVDVGTTAGAQIPQVLVPADTSVPSAAPTPIRHENVRRLHRASDWWDRWGNKPRYARQFIWDIDENTKPTSAEATITYPPVPSVPENEYANLPACNTIRENPHLFKIVTPINVDLFESYLSSHPNREFVHPVCHGLRSGFWPWDITDDPNLPLTWDNSHRPLKDPSHLEFIRTQRDAEVNLEQFSPPFGPALLPGMYSMPLGVVPKPHSDKLRLVFDHSAEPFSLNSMIPSHERSVHLDNLTDLGRALRKVRESVGSRRDLVVWKSDLHDVV